MRNVLFAFDLDGTVTCEETLPALARKIGAEADMELLTRLTMEGKLAFEQSFLLRYYVLRNLPLERIHQVMDRIQLNEEILYFIREHKDSCVIVTGNLESWIKPLKQKLECPFFSSRERLREGCYVPEISFVDKRAVIESFKRKGRRVIAVGDGANDIPMLEAADVAVAYGGVHLPAAELLECAAHAVRDGGELCSLLEKI